jgi:Post-segregation antitoxin CcdA
MRALRPARDSDPGAACALVADADAMGRSGVDGVHDLLQEVCGSPQRSRTTAWARHLLRYASYISDTSRITVTLPSELVAELKKITDNVSAYVAEAVARQIRHRLLVDELQRRQDEFGAFIQEELDKARNRLFSATDRTASTSA